MSEAQLGPAARRWRAVGSTAAPAAARAADSGGAAAKAADGWEGGPVAIVGGGLSGLACGWALKRRGVPALVLDTGRRGPGGRASSRRLPLGGQPQAVDHAVQAFTAQGDEVRALLEEAERAGAVRRWEGRVGTLKAGARFAARDAAAEGPLWIGNAEAGIGSLADWLASEQEVVRDVWVAKLGAAPDGDWALLDQRGRPVGGKRSYRYVAMAHNGKCADRLINTAPMTTAAHSPLRCKFTSTASATSDRLELSSLWVCVVTAPRGAAAFEGAFVEGSEVLSWVGNNSAKYPQEWRDKERPADAWTLISTPKYGSANKCPQEAIPDPVRQKVSRELCQAFKGLLGLESLQGVEVLHLQLWGAALPLNVCAQHFVHDPEACVGVCGDWLTAPSVEGALFSGLALAGAVDAHFRGGGVANTGAKRFHGLRDCHAIGSFGACGQGQTAREVVGLAAGGGEAAGGAASAPTAAEEPGAQAPGPSKWRRRGAAGRGAAPVGSAGEGAAGKHRNGTAGEADSVWYFGFGANINPWKLREQRKIVPLKQVPGRLPGWRLVFNHKGGMGNIERLKKLPPGDGGPEAAHGMLLLLRQQDFRRLAQMEHEYGEEELLVEAYDGRAIQARAFVSQAQWRLATYPAPPERYLKLIQEGCKTMRIDEAYQSWLQTLSSVKGQRGPEYWAAPGNAQDQQQQQRSQGQQQPKAKEHEGSSHSADGPLHLASLADFAVEGGAALVDIGANLGKCSPQDLAEQLARAGAARVDHLVLTGCSVKSSQAAQRLAGAWSGAAGLALALRHLGAAARAELEAAGVQELPALRFTAGVHPHDAKTCTGETLGILRAMAQDPKCVAIGECGLDYDRMFSAREVQLEWCRKQVELAVELGLPLFLHERDRDDSKGTPLGSSGELLEILQSSGVKPSRVCVHCFTGSKGELEAYVSRGYFIGLTGFAGMQKRGAHIRDLLAQGALPLRQLMIETDCPFMTPDKRLLPASIGLQGRRNEPCAMPAVCRAVAECLGVPPAEVARATTENAASFFGL